MQPIGIFLQDEHGKIITDSNLDFGRLLAEIHDRDQEKTFKTLWGIDPYGDTIFNTLQVPQLISELKTFKFSEELASVSSQIQDFILTINTHEYICFSGN